MPLDHFFQISNQIREVKSASKSTLVLFRQRPWTVSIEDGKDLRGPWMYHPCRHATIDAYQP